MSSEWENVSVGSIAKKIAMGPFGSNIKVETFVSDGVPIISGAHLRGVKLADLEFNYITKEHAERLKNSIVFEGDVVFTHAGNVGQVAMIPKNCKYQQYVISQRQFYLRCDLEKAIPEFITYYFHSYIGRGQLLANVNSTGVPSIARPSTYLKSIELLLPDLNEQKAIADTLSCLDDKIELNNRMNKTLEEMAQTIFKSWFVDFEPFQDGEFVDSELGRIPKGWRVGTVDEFSLEMMNGGTPRRKSEEYWNSPDVPWIKTGEIKDDIIASCEEYISYKGLQESSAKLLPLNSVLLAMYGATAGKVGLLKIVASTNQACCAMICKTLSQSIYLYLFLLTNQSYIKSLANGAAQQNLSKDVISKLKIIIPFESIIESTKFDVIFDLREKNIKENILLQSLRDTLLPKLISGEIRIPVQED